MELLTAAQMRALERHAIATGPVTGPELMERAGRGVLDAVEARFRTGLGGSRVAVLCGPGNNGGDGYVIARLLAERRAFVDVFALAPPAARSADAAGMAQRWRAGGGSVRPLGAPGADRYFAVFDALFGTGLSRPLDPEIPGLARTSALCLDRGGGDLGWIAVDAPSGLDLDSGRALGAVLPARFTVTFEHPKLGHYLADGPDLCGELAVAPLRLGVERWIGFDPAIVMATGRPDGALLRKAGHKYDHGHALVLSGGVGRGGAARLAARGALRIGAGLVTLGCPPAALVENAARLDAVMLRPLAGAEALAEVLSDRRINALCLGPGLGSGRAREMVPEALAARRATVLDADALTAFAEDPAALLALLHDRVVLTPHMGEFGRLFPDLKARLDAPALRGPAFSKVDAARAAAARAGCTLLLKGPDTVIAAPDGRCAVNSAHYGRAAPWLATAGSGDVLAGFIAGLLARGLGPMAAAEAAAWLHVDCARSFGPGLIAEDLPEELPRVLRGPPA